jgi:hypothetical protein
MKIVMILCLFFSFGFCEILSLSPKEKRAMKNDFAILDNAFSYGYTEYFAEFAGMFLETYKLASVEKDGTYRNIYNTVKNAVESYTETRANMSQIITDSVVIDDKEMKKLFSTILLSPAEDIIAFADKYPNYRPKDILGALERARVNDLSAILLSISKADIATNEIVRYCEIYGDSVSIAKIKSETEKMVIKNTALLKDYRKIFGITEFDEKMEQILYNKVMYDTDYKNLIVYIENFPNGKYAKFISELVNNYR